MNYKAVIFDLDGTLVNTLQDLANTVNTVLKEYRYDTYPVEKYRFMVGNGIKKLVERAMPSDSSAALIDEAFARFKEIYAVHQLDNTVPYAGIKEMLDELKEKNILIAICSNKHDKAVKKIVDTLFPQNMFQAIIGDLPGLKRKPDPGKVLRIAKEMGVKPEETVYAGDSSVDIETAINAGMLPVGVLWGFRPEKELVDRGAKVLLSKPDELFSKINFIAKNL